MYSGCAKGKKPAPSPSPFVILKQILSQSPNLRAAEPLGTKKRQPRQPPSWDLGRHQIVPDSTE